MNKATKLKDKQFILELLKKKVLPLYPDFSSIKSFKLNTYKDNVWEGNTYHIVYEYRTTFLTATGKKKTLPIFCSAHSDEPRKNVYDSLRFLWDHGFGQGYLTIPHPLFYSDYFRGTFYRGVEGRNLYQYIRENKLKIVNEIVEKTARWFAKLHGTNTVNAKNFNKENSRIATVFPGIEHIILRIGERYPEHKDCYKKIYDIVNSREREFLAGTDKRWLVHGDAHPENIIKMGQKKIAVIDFTDLCLSDFARDIGSFLQQLEFMANRKIEDKESIKKIKQNFLDSYFSFSREHLTQEVEKRINTYYCWTTMRTATHFLLKAEPEPERAYPLIKKVCQELNIRS